jgi:amino acid transporter
MNADTKRVLNNKFQTMGMIGFITLIFTLVLITVGDVGIVVDENTQVLLQFAILCGFLVYFMSMVCMSVLLFSTAIQAIVEDAVAKKNDNGSS